MTAQALSLTAVADSTTTPATLLFPNASSPAVSVNFDSTATQIIDLFGAFSLNNANAIQVLQYELISPNWGG